MLELAEGSYILALRYNPQYTEVEEELVKNRVEQLVVCLCVLIEFWNDNLFFIVFLSEYGFSYWAMWASSERIWSSSSLHWCYTGWKRFEQEFKAILHLHMYMYYSTSVVMSTSPVSNGYVESSVPQLAPPSNKSSRERFTLPPRMQARINQPPPSPSPPSLPRREMSRYVLTKPQAGI